MSRKAAKYFRQSFKKTMKKMLRGLGFKARLRLAWKIILNKEKW